MSLWNLICQAALLDMICEWLSPKKHKQRPDTDYNMYQEWTEDDDQVADLESIQNDYDKLTEYYRKRLNSAQDDLYDDIYDDW